MKLVRNRPEWIVGVCIGLVLCIAVVATGRPRKSDKPDEVTLVGLVVDLQSYLTEKCPNEDYAKCTRDNIRGGVPAALETEDGLVVIGMGDKGPARLLVPLAYQTAEVTGTLYEYEGLLYLDMSAAKLLREEGAEEEVPHEQPPVVPEGIPPTEP